MAVPMPYDQNVGDRICGELASGRSLRSICDDDGMPAASTVFKWLRESSAFAEQYARAREEQADALADEILDVADDGRNDWMKTNGDDDAGWRENGETIGRSRLRVDARKWIASKLKPKKYGDRTTLAGDPESPIEQRIVQETVTRGVKPADSGLPGQGAGRADSGNDAER